MQTRESELMANPDLTVEGLHQRVANLVREDAGSVERDTSLFEFELNSPILMQWIGRWRQCGIEVNLVDPAENLTISAWSRLIRGRTPATVIGNGDSVGLGGVEVLRDLTRCSGKQIFTPVVFTSALSLRELFDANARPNFGDPTWMILQNPQVLLDAQITEISSGLLFAAFKQLVYRLAEHDNTWETPLDNPLPMHQRKACERVNDTARPRSNQLLHESFFTVSCRAPSAPAMLWDKRGALSYGELADRALRVANALPARGVQQGDAVGVTLPKGSDQAVAVLGVLAAGNLYVPAGVEQSALRRERILRTAGVQVVLDKSILPITQRATALDAPVTGSPDKPVYVIFTAGSTGEPKNMKMSHRAAMNTIYDINSWHQIGPDDRILGVSALDFDPPVNNPLHTFDQVDIFCHLPKEFMHEDSAFSRI
jgi:non-ribosomal peptide synthetase component F